MAKILQQRQIEDSELAAKRDLLVKCFRHTVLINALEDMTFGDDDYFDDDYF